MEEAKINVVAIIARNNLCYDNAKQDDIESSKSSNCYVKVTVHKDLIGHRFTRFICAYGWKRINNYNQILRMVMGNKK